ncbi:MAG: TetR/AcrR family transcriptional regulator [Acidobacteria bacterium]|nr:TetR/AcrR family transcriptional regulator [Acidobacteriota bacterium]
MDSNPTTKTRVLDAALLSFGTRGVDAISLDALAADVGIAKQTILYYFASKDGLVRAVVLDAACTVRSHLEAALETAPEGWGRVEALVHAVFRLTLRQPELMGLVRELSRPGSMLATTFVEQFDPLVERARTFLEAEMLEGRLLPCDPNLLLLSAYSTVIGVATEVEVLRALGIEPTMRSLVLRRRELLRFLHLALVGSELDRRSVR